MRRVLGIGLAAFMLCGARNLTVHNVSPADAEKLLAEGGVLLLDLRSPKEFDGGHIPGATPAPLAEFSKSLKGIPKDKTQPVLVYDAWGARSTRAAHELYEEGYKDVYNLIGGMRAWTAAQKPIQVPAVNGKAVTSSN